MNDITNSKVYSAVITAGRRILSIFQFGPKTVNEYSPFGDDSNPIQGMDALYIETSNDNAPAICGYINTQQLAAPGEKRAYSLKVDSDTQVVSVAFYTWMKADGTFEIGGDTNNLLRYEPLAQALQLLVEKINVELPKISAGIATGGGVYTPTPVSIDISAAKIDEIKTL